MKDLWSLHTIHEARANTLELKENNRIRNPIRGPILGTMLGGSGALILHLVAALSTR